MMEDWNNGMMEDWNNGIMRCGRRVVGVIQVDL
jgi:predicted Rossmann-fold nucleotide-binding protein